MTLFGTEEASRQVEALSEARFLLWKAEQKNEFLTALVRGNGRAQEVREDTKDVGKSINKPNDIHKIALADFPLLAEEIRQF